jgi:Transposase DDE domain group 1
VIVKAEHSAQGSNPRFVVSNLTDEAQTLYDEIFCARGEMENRIKEQQLGLFADRTSAHAWWANQFRLLLSSAAYILIEALRRLGLHGTELARAQVNTIRLKLLKIGTIILRNTRRIRLFFSSAYPYQDLFAVVYGRLNSA